MAANAGHPANATPTRDRHPFPQSIIQSPAIFNSTSSLSNLPSSSSLSSSHSVTPQALLKAHDSAQDPTMAALDQAVNERNVLSAQNAQLWKLIEKQRSGYNQILKELERIRGERDIYKAKVISLGGSIEKRSKHPGDRLNHRPSIDDQQTDVTTSDSRTKIVRTQSNDNATQRLQSSQLHSSRSHEPLSPRNHDTSSQLNTSFSIPPPPVSPTTVFPTTPSKPQKTSSAPQLDHQRNENPSISDLTSTSIEEDSYAQPQYQQDTTSNQTPTKYDATRNFEAASASSNTQQQTALTLETAPTNSTVQIVMSPATPQASSSPYSQTQAIASANLPEPQPMLSAYDSRSSRITLPDEASQYIVNMVDSPIPSPHLETFTAKPKVSSNLVPQPSIPDAQITEFLDMDEEDGGGGDDDDDDDGTLAESDDEAQGVTELAYQNQFSDTELQANSLPVSSSTGDTVQAQDVWSGQSNNSQVDSPYSSTLQLLPDAGDQGSIHNQVPSNQQQAVINNSTISFQSSEQSHTPSMPSSSQQSQQQQPTIPTRMDSRQTDSKSDTTSETQLQGPYRGFRALPLLSSDLPHTKVTVSHSYVRPNDRGKEVLSFVIIVNPGHGKEQWKVEKMYSDVLALDQRVRNAVGKSVGKKIMALPEGKLWKDPAPAKVDQRKAVLEQYLQTLVNLPIKNNDELIAYLTTDIVRHKPVVQAGYKEGYLTKRGKNFGGWKTRYFVLQGPVLEYYDSRGGAHLGSIQIAGAQIGRQQRNDRPSNDNDEKEYRHAFLIVESKRGPGGSHPRHVLCAESDEERDAWVEMLVRYFTGTYSEEPLSYGPSTSMQQQQHSNLLPPSRSSTSDSSSSRKQPPPRGTSLTNEISISKGTAVPISQLSQDPNNAKLFQTPLSVEDYNRSSSPIKSMEPSPVERNASRGPPYESQNQNLNARRVLERLQGLPSSLPDSSPLSSGPSFQTEPTGTAQAQRPNSELGHYGDTQASDRYHHNNALAASRKQSPERHRSATRDHPTQEGKKSYHSSPTSGTSSGATTIASGGVGGEREQRVPSPEKLEATKAKISGPLNGTPLPQGFKFGAKDSTSETTPNVNESRRDKVKSKFWGWKNPGDKPVVVVPRAVFGVPLEESLDVAQICNLPAIVFRSIQYLEAKKADQEEGIYRLSGSSAVIKGLKDRFNAEGDIDLLASDEYWDPHAVAGLLKSYLRELPASILTRDLHLKFLAVIDFVDAQERIRELSQLIASLPLANYSLLRALTAHLILIVQNSSVNKMTMRNVGIVFSPTLGIPAGVFSLMLGEFNRVFNVNAGKEDGDETEPLKRNSRQYSDAAADLVLGLEGRSLNGPPADDTTSEADEYSVQGGDSSAETGEGEANDSMLSLNSGDENQQQHTVRISPPDTPVASRTTSSKAANTANSKGLNVSVTPNRGNRYSRIGIPGDSRVMGLPSSPRPPHSPLRTTVDNAGHSMD